MSWSTWANAISNLSSNWPIRAEQLLEVVRPGEPRGAAWKDSLHGTDGLRDGNGDGWPLGWLIQHDRYRYLHGWYDSNDLESQFGSFIWQLRQDDSVTQDSWWCHHSDCRASEIQKTDWVKSRSFDHWDRNEPLRVVGKSLVGPNLSLTDLSTNNSALSESRFFRWHPIIV